jgi:hypothetical protein
MPNPDQVQDDRSGIQAFQHAEQDLDSPSAVLRVVSLSNLGSSLE